MENIINLKNTDSHINHSKLDFPCEAGAAAVNVRTGRLLFERSDMSVGANSFAFGVSHIYDSIPNDRITPKMGNGWKLNIQQYIYLSTEKDDRNRQIFHYVDANGYTHKFEEYDVENGSTKYFDKTGLNLTLFVKGNDRHIENISGERLEFDNAGRLEKIVSATNSAIAKRINYDEYGKLVSMYDARSSSRSIRFYYNSRDQLSKMECFENKIHLVIEYGYDIDGNLCSIKEQAGSDGRYSALFQYKDGLLRNAVSLGSNLGLRFEYDNLGRVTGVSSGVTKTKLNYSAPTPAIFVSSNHFAGTKCFAGQTEREFLGYSIDEGKDTSADQTSSDVNYANHRTTVANEKNVVIEYFFNQKGFTTAILERKNSNNPNNLMTLTKDGGKQFLTDGTGDIINGVRAKAIGVDENFSFPVNKVNDYLSSFYPKRATIMDKLAPFTNRFMLSFWAKLPSNHSIDQDVKAIAMATMSTHVAPSTGFPFIPVSGETAYEYSFLDNTALDSWQFVTIPILLNTYPQNTNGFIAYSIKSSLQSLKLSFSGLANPIEISNIRLAPDKSNDLQIGDIPLRKVDRIEYIDTDNKEQVLAVGSANYMTDSDIMQTVYNAAFVNRTVGENEVFDFVYKGGTKRIANIRNLRVSKGTEQASVFIASDGRSSVVNSVVSPESSGKSVTTFEYKTGTGIHKRLIKQTTTASARKMAHITWLELVFDEISSFFGGFAEKNPFVPWENKGETIVEMDYLGNTLLEVDTYGVTTEYVYDSFGNPVRKTVGHANTTEKITNAISYNNSGSQKDREHKTRETSTGEKQVDNAIHSFVNKDTHYGSLDPFGNPDYSKEGGAGAKTGFLYDSLFRIRGTESTGMQADGSEGIAKSLLTYGHQNRVESISDGTGLEYEFSYNHFGDTTEFSQVIDGEKQVILQKDYEYSLPQGKSSVTEKVFSDNDTIASKTTASFDRHGRMLSVKVNNQSSVAYSYQNVDSSPSTAQVECLTDSDANEINNYRYDDENRPCGYSIINSENSKEKLKVTQTASGRTRYEINGGKAVGDTFETVIEFDEEKLQNPRVARTKYYAGSWLPILVHDDELEGYKVNYIYDTLGRLDKKSCYHSVTEQAQDFLSHIPIIGGILNIIGDLNDFKTRINAITGFDYKAGSALVEKQSYTLGLFSLEAGTVLQTIATSLAEYEYDGRSNISKIKSTGFQEGDIAQQELFYDSFDRVTREVLKLNGSVAKDRKYVYNNKSQVKEIRDNQNNGSIVKSFTYDNYGRLTDDHNGQSRKYDNYGNVVKIGADKLVWERGNLLKSFGSARYAYNHQDARIKKTVGDATTEFFLDGSKILGENRSNGIKLRYVYDATGLCGVRYSTNNGLFYDDYLYQKDALGNIAGITRCGLPVCKYRYDAWGNTSILNSNGTAGDFAANHIANANPFRWKGYYYDSETNWYYMDGRYYDPAICSYITVDKPETLYDNIGVRFAYCRYLVTLNNAVALIAMAATVWTSETLAEDTTFVRQLTIQDYKNSLNPLTQVMSRLTAWLNLLDPWVRILIGVILIIVALVITIVTYGATAGLLVGVIVAVFTSAISSGFAAVDNGGSFAKGAFEGAATALLIAGIFAVISAAIQAIGALKTKVANKAQANSGADAGNAPASEVGSNQPQCCFIAGTLVLCKGEDDEEIHKKIEDIEEGDLVWAYDEDTGVSDWKPVVQLFRNKASTKTQLTIKADDGTVDEITSTPGHKYYLPDNKRNRNANERLEHASYEGLSDKWVSACDLKKGDRVLLANADSLTGKPKFGIVIAVKTEECEEFTTYNFEVADFHTYYVGENGVCVHNAACDWEWGKGSFNSVDDSLNYHAGKHAGKLKLDPSDTAGYLRKAQNFAETAVQRGVKPLPGFVEGATSNIRAYPYAGKIIWMDKANKIIVNFFVPG